MWCDATEPGGTCRVCRYLGGVSPGVDEFLHKMFGGAGNRPYLCSVKTDKQLLGETLKRTILITIKKNKNYDN